MMGRSLLVRLLLLVTLATSLVRSQGLPGVRGNRRSRRGNNGIRKMTRAILWCLEGSIPFPELVRLQWTVGPALTSCLDENGLALRPSTGPPSSVGPAGEVPVTPGTVGKPPTFAPGGTVVTSSPGVIPSFGGVPEGIIPDPFGGQPPTMTDKNPADPGTTEKTPVFGTAEGIIPDPFGGKPPILTEDGLVVSAGDTAFPSADVAEGYGHLESLITFPSSDFQKTRPSAADMHSMLRTGNIEGRVRAGKKNISEQVLSCTASRLSSNVNTQTNIIATLKSCPSQKTKNRLINTLRRISVANSALMNAIYNLRDDATISTLYCLARADLGTMASVLPELTQCLESRSTVPLDVILESAATVNCLHSVMASAYLFTVGRIPSSVSNCGSVRFRRQVDQL